MAKVSAYIREWKMTVVSQHSGKTIAAKDDLRVIQCANCGIKHLDPIPASASADYSSGFYHCSVKPSMGEDYERDQKWWKETHLDWLSLIPARPGGRLLDVGSGTASFLKAAQLAGWDVVGLEPDYEMSKRDPAVLWLEYQDYLGTRYDVVSAHWVLEHLSDASHFMRWAKARLDDLGYLLITLPNDFSEIQTRAMEIVNQPYYWLDKYHINYWNKMDFLQFAKCHGFETVATYGSWQPEKYLIDGMNYLEDQTLGRQFHRYRIENDLSESQRYRRGKYRLWGELGWGRDLTYILRKML